MVVLMAKNRIYPEKREAFLALAKTLVEESRKEAGCLQYDLVADTNQENVYYFLEKYQDDAALQAHQTSSHFQSIVPQFADLRPKPSEVTKCELID